MAYAIKKRDSNHCFYVKALKFVTYVMKNLVEKDANNLREKMSDEEIRKIFKTNLKYFQKIKNGFVQSWRHSMYHSSENKAENQRFLR